VQGLRGDEAPPARPARCVPLTAMECGGYSVSEVQGRYVVAERQ
jgi:hypothetical protein